LVEFAPALYIVERALSLWSAILHVFPGAKSKMCVVLRPRYSSLIFRRLITGPQNSRVCCMISLMRRDEFGAGWKPI